jgi:hypothetical protein
MDGGRIIVGGQSRQIFPKQSKRNWSRVCFASTKS